MDAAGAGRGGLEAGRGECDPAKTQALKERIVAGFYGKDRVPEVCRRNGSRHCKFRDWGRSEDATPRPSLQTGRADFPHPAFQSAICSIMETGLFPCLGRFQAEEPKGVKIQHPPAPDPAFGLVALPQVFSSLFIRFRDSRRFWWAGSLRPGIYFASSLYWEKAAHHPANARLDKAARRRIDSRP